MKVNPFLAIGHNYIEPSLPRALQRSNGRDIFRYRMSRVVLQIGLESVLKWSGGGPCTLRFSLKIVDDLNKGHVWYTGGRSLGLRF
jgi:hypothetical protein